MNTGAGKLRVLAQKYETRANRLRAEAEALLRLADNAREEAAKLDARSQLPETGHSGKVNSRMVQAHKMAISEGRNLKDPFLKAIRAAKEKYVLRDLAVALDVSAAILSAHRLPPNRESSRPIPQSRAERIQALTGWPADERHWPAGITKGK